MGIGYFANSNNEETSTNVVTFPESALSQTVPVQSVESTESGMTNVIELHSAQHVDQLKNIRERRVLTSENATLAEKRIHRIEKLKQIFADDELKLKGIKEVEVLEGLLREQSIDSLQGQTLQYKKSMLAVYYGLPVEYIQADANSSNIESLNLSIKSLSRLVAQLPADDAETVKQAERLEELKKIKSELSAEMNNADKVLLTRKSIVFIISGVARFIRGES